MRSDLSTISLQIRTHGIQVCLICGDVFDSDHVTNETKAILERELGNCPDCQFFIAPGNHDILCEGSPYHTMKLPDNVHLFPSERTCFHLDELNADVYGYAFDGKNGNQNPLVGWQVERPERLNILCVHGDLDAADSPYGPFAKSDIGSSPFDYVALGHIHKGTGVQCENGVFWAYPGCMEGRGFDETGYKGVLAGTLEKGKAELSFCRISKRRYEIAECDVDGCGQLEALERARSVARPFGEDTILRLVLTGVTKEGILLLPETVAFDTGTTPTIEIVDRTTVNPGYTDLETSATIKGVFYRLMREKIDRGEATEEALKYGLLALDGKEIADYEEEVK